MTADQALAEMAEVADAHLTDAASSHKIELWWEAIKPALDQLRAEVAIADGVFR